MLYSFHYGTIFAITFIDILLAFILTSPQRCNPSVPTEFFRPKVGNGVEEEFRDLAAPNPPPPKKKRKS